LVADVWTFAELLGDFRDSGSCMEKIDRVAVPQVVKADDPDRVFGVEHFLHAC
jgi:hypothetical protein